MALAVPEPAPAPPAPEPRTVASELPRVRAAVTAIRCAVLRVGDTDGTLSVTGTVTSENDRGKIQKLMDELDRGVPRTVEVAVAPPGLCEPLAAVEAPRAANDARERPLTLAAVGAEPALRGGQELVLELRGPEFEAHLRVDYFTQDGNVVHLLPNPLEPGARLDGAAVRRLGEREAGGRFWTVGPPFGRELIVAIASREPLFAPLRPEIEPAGGYLAELKRVLANTGAAEPVAAVLFISTMAP